MTEVRSVYVETIPAIDPRLRRQVRHDSESRRYAFPTEGLSVASVGAGGYFYLDVDVFGQLLARKGDATVFTPASLSPPVPQPPAVEPPALQRERDLFAALGVWVKAPHTGMPGRIAAALRTEFGKAGLS